MLPRPRNLNHTRSLYISVGCPHLDSLLGGGLLRNSITEISGEASSGKTQFSLQCLLTVQLSLERGGANGKAVYIHTEGEPPMKRLTALAGCFDRCV